MPSPHKNETRCCSIPPKMLHEHASYMLIMLNIMNNVKKYSADGAFGTVVSAVILRQRSQVIK